MTRKTSDEEIIAFATAQGCSEIVIQRLLQSSGNRMSPVIYVKFKCICEKHGRKKWKDYKKNPLCTQCMKDVNLRVSDTIIKNKLNENNCEFICSRRERKNNKTRIFVKFICSCDKYTSRIIKELQWDIISSGGKCADCGNKRRKESNIIAYIERSDEIREKMKKTCNKKYGVDHHMQNSEIYEKVSKNSFKYKTYTFPSGRNILCQGYEPLALDLLLKNGINEHDILTDSEISASCCFPKFIYEIDGKNHRYYPDIYVASEDKFIEVKSDYTVTIEKDNVMLKAQTVKKYGYNIEIWIFDQKERLKEIIYI